MSDIPPISGKVGLDTTDFKTALSELNRDIRVIESGFKATAAALGDWGNSIDGLEARIGALNGEIGIQQKKIEALREEYQRVAAEKGETSRAAEELKIKLNRETEALNKMQTELGQSEVKLDDLKTSASDAGKGMDKLEDETDDSARSLEKFKGIANGLKMGLAAGIGAVAALGAAVAGVGLALGKMVIGSGKSAAELVDLSNQTGISTERLQELAYIGDQVGVSTDTMTGSLARLTRSMGEARDQAVDFSGKTSTAVTDAALQVSDVQAKLAEETKSIEGELSEAIVGIANSTNQELQRLQQSHNDRMISIRASIDETERDYEYDRLERREDTDREISRMDEDYSHDREKLVKELGEAESDAEKARLQERLDELDYEHNTRRKRRLEDAEEAQKDAEYSKNQKIKALQEQIAAEEAEYRKQKEQIVVRQAEQVTATRERYAEELTAAKTRYEGEIEIAKQALKQINASAGSGKLGDAAAAFEKLGVQVTDANGNLRDSETVFGEALSALGKIENQTEADAIAMAIFGRSAMELNPLARTSAEELARLADQAHNVGAVVSDETITALEEFDDRVASLIASVKGTMSELAVTFEPGFSGLLGIAQKYMGQLNTIVTESDGDIVKMADGVGRLVGEIANDIAKRAPELLQAGLRIVQGLLNAIITNLPQLMAASTAIITSLIQFLADNLPLLIRSGVQIVAALVMAIIENLPELVDAGIEALLALIDGLTEALPELIPAIVEAILLIIDTLIENLPLLVESGGKLLLAIVDGLMKALPKLLEKMPELVQSMIDAIIKLLPLLGDLALKIIQAIATGIIENLPEIGQAAKEIFATVAKALPEVLESLWETGKNIVLGVWQGIKDNTGWFLEQVQGFFGNMVNTSHEALDARSPSRVFADLGKNSALGYIQGLRKTMKEGQKALQMAFGETTLSLRAQTLPVSTGLKPSTSKVINNNYYLSANYSNQPFNSVAADIKLLQMLYGEA